ncbi:hypothetical protein CIP107557_02190 [Corynebacterium diphtheriae]|nr:hypothetical protein CIP107543_01990 [Corynebacterium diphtheriae]CAB0621847.1 hypothetical protein CIP107557_02190 [Corynebacterium diphtheriae]CAB0666280.1 hypothetical protein CIP107567_02119 [Corynebacterium diphtheriae]
MSLRRLFTVLLGCPHVGHSLMGLMGSASMMVTITMFCGAADGVDDDISVGRHSRSLVCTDGLDTLIPTKPRTLISCATPYPRRTNQCTLKPEEPR